MNTSVLRYHEGAAFLINTAYTRDTKTLNRAFSNMVGISILGPKPHVLKPNPYTYTLYSTHLPDLLLPLDSSLARQTPLNPEPSNLKSLNPQTSNP